MAIFSAIASLVAGVSSFFAGLGAIGTAILQAAAGIGLNLLSQALAGEPEKPKFSVQGKLQTGGDVPRSFQIGYTATAGSLVYANSWGSSSKTPNAYFVQVIALSDLPIAGLAEVWVNGEKVTLGAVAHAEYGFPVTEYRDDGKDYLWIKFYDGNQTVADPYLVSKFAGAQRQYEATRVGRGIAYVICTSRIQQELFTGFPQFKFAVNGIKLYDPSKDSSVGGVGSHRWNDSATWGGDGDHLPAVQAYNLLRGITYGGKWLYGLQSLPAARLPASHWIAQIAKCRVSNASTGDQPIYRAGGEIAVNAPVSDAVAAILTACQGRLPEIGGTYKLYVGAPGGASFTFDDDSIVSTAEQSFTPFFGLADTINGIAAKYPSPAEGWNTAVAPPLYSAQFENEDGKRRLMADVSLDFVPYAAQVQRLMKSALEEARRARRHTHVLPPEFWGVEPGDIMSWSSQRNGYVTKLFRVDGVIDDANLDVMVDLTEVDPSDYSWDQRVDYRVPTDGFVGKPYPPVQPMEGWTVVPDTVPDGSGTARRPAIRISCAADQDDVQKVHVRVRVKATGVVVFDSEATAYAAPYSWLLAGAWALPNTVYQAQGRFVPFSNRKTDWSSWLDVTTPDIRLGDQDVYLPGVIADLQSFVNDATLWLRDGTRQLIEVSRSTAMALINQDAANFADKQTLRQELVSRAGALSAAYRSEIVVATGPTSALSRRLETVEVTIPKLATVSVVDALTARVDVNAAGIATLAGRATVIENTLPGKASVSALDAVATTVSAQGDTLTAYGTRISSVETALPGKASVSAVNALDTRVTSAEGTITAQGNALTSLDTTVGKFSASGKFRTTVEATPSGALARIGLSAGVTAAGTTYEASIFLDAMSGGKTRIVMLAEQIAMINDAGTVKFPFVFSGSTLYLQSVNIQNAIVGNLQVGTTNIAFDSIVAGASMSAGNTNIPINSTWTDIASFTINNVNPSPVFASMSGAGTADNNGASGTLAVSWRLINTTTGTVLFSTSTSASAGTIKTVSISEMKITTNDVQGNNTYKIQAKADGSISGGNVVTASGSAQFIYWKR